MNNPITLEQFNAEIQEVQSTLLSATSELINPLGDLVRSQIKHSQPPIYGAIVLTVSSQAKPVSAIDNLHQKRIFLAAALEMLHIALNVHRLLVNSTRAAKQNNGQGNQVDDTPNRAFIGSTILAGDYCFSRAAQMAAKTDNPDVVATFSLALQQVSEGLLREQFHQGNNVPESSQPETYATMHQLLLSGAQAAAQLVGLTDKEVAKSINLSQEVAQYLQLHTQNANLHDSKFGSNHSSNHDAAPTQSQFPHTEPPASSWQAFYQWLHLQRTNHGHAVAPRQPQ